MSSSRYSKQRGASSSEHCYFEATTCAEISNYSQKWCAKTWQQRRISFLVTICNASPSAAPCNSDENKLSDLTPRAIKYQCKQRLQISKLFTSPDAHYYERGRREKEREPLSRQQGDEREPTSTRLCHQTKCIVLLLCQKKKYQHLRGNNQRTAGKQKHFLLNILQLARISSQALVNKLVVRKLVSKSTFPGQIRGKRIKLAEVSSSLGTGPKQGLRSNTSNADSFSRRQKKIESE